MHEQLCATLNFTQICFEDNNACNIINSIIVINTLLGSTGNINTVTVTFRAPAVYVTFTERLQIRTDQIKNYLLSWLSSWIHKFSTNRKYECLKM